MSYRKHLMPSDISPSAAYEATAVESDTDTISRQAAIDIVTPHDDNRVMRDALEELPPAQPERIKGRWIYTGVKFPNWEGQIVSEAFCSECNGISYFRRALDKWIGANICPNCGADMTGEQNES